MLKKLLKYDLKYNLKFLSIFYFIALISASLARIFSFVSDSLLFNIISQIFNGTFIAMIINILINSLMHSWVRFIQNCYKDESYLTHTLPVKRNTIFLSKVLSGIISLVFSFTIILLGIIIAYASKENILFIQNFISQIASFFDANQYLFLLSIFGIFFLEILYILLLGYLAIIIGYKSNNRKNIKTIIWGFVIYLASTLCTLLILFILALFNSDLMNIIKTTNPVSFSSLKLILIIATFIYTIYGVLCYIIGNKLFMKGVNIE